MRKVLVVNKYHFISGGAERYFLSVMDGFRRRGIEAIPLSVNYPQTLPTPYQKYFIDPIIKEGPAKIVQQNPDWRQKAALARQAIYNPLVKKAVKRIYEDHKPDIAYLLNINNHISPSVIDACHELGIPVVMRLSDFNLVCSSNMYYRAGSPCTACKKGLLHAVMNRCVHDSYAKSAVNVFALWLHRTLGTYKKVSAFIAPTEFMRQDLIELGFPAEKVYQINTFKKPVGAQPPDLENPYILFVGRFVEYKGAAIAMEAFSKIEENKRVSLVMMGDEGDDYALKMREMVKRFHPASIKLLPFERDKEKLNRMIQKSLFMVVPSQMYENLPHTILEAFSCARPVIATRLGSIPEIIKEGQNGLLFEYGNLDDFAEKMQWLIEHPAERERMGEVALTLVQNFYSEEAHFDQLLRIFNTLVPNANTAPSEAVPQFLGV